MECRSSKASSKRPLSFSLDAHLISCSSREMLRLPSARFKINAHKLASSKGNQPLPKAILLRDSFYDVEKESYFSFPVGMILSSTASPGWRNFVHQFFEVLLSRRSILKRHPDTFPTRAPYSTPRASRTYLESLRMRRSIIST